MLNRAKADGAGRFTLGGGRPGGDLADKNFVEPTVIADADPMHEISQTEVFGPVLVIMKFATEEEAIALANSTPYGLATYLQTNKIERVHRMTERLHSGGVYVSGDMMPAMPHRPFGGLGLSGYGKEGGRAGIDAFLHYKTVAIA